jgi:hypothetical protein
MQMVDDDEFDTESRDAVIECFSVRSGVDSSDVVEEEN